MLGYAIYNGDRVYILELLIGGNHNIALINYGGPVWVGLHELSNLELINVTATITKKGA